MREARPRGERLATASTPEEARGRGRDAAPRATRCRAPRRSSGTSPPTKTRRRSSPPSTRAGSTDGITTRVLRFPWTKSRYAHVGFDTERALFDFAAAFDARAYDDAFGGEWRARVEYAPYQKIPRLKPRIDKREGTIERDADYKKFVEKLAEDPVAMQSAEVLLDRREREKKALERANGGKAPVPSVLPPCRAPFLSALATCPGVGTGGSSCSSSVSSTPTWSSTAAC